MTRRTVLLVFGGESSEHEVSVASAHNVYAAIDSDRYNVLLCFIDKHGKWWLLDEWKEGDSLHGGRQLLAALGTKSFVTLPGNDVIHPDVILPILHGKNGEDGTVQGLAQLLHIPIVGCDMTTSAVCMDKVLTKRVLESNKIKTAPYIVHAKGDKLPAYAATVAELGTPLFIKPSRAGSSVGVSKVKNENEFLPALQLALAHDDKILIESAIDGRELEIAILGTPPHHKASGIGEIIPGAEFYDYDDKYSPTSTSTILTNIDLPESLREKITTTALDAYRVLGCTGMARVDFLVAGSTPYIIEVNTIPGFTNISMYPKLWRASGMHYPVLIEALVEDALKKR